MLVGALAAAAVAETSDLARAQGFFDFFFGGYQQRPTPPRDVNTYAEPSPGIGRIAPPPMGQENVRQGPGDTGHAVGYCVRLCDGQHFPMEHLANATPVETCQAMCPASKTKVFFGSAIDHAVAADGARYADLDTAFLYRKQLVAKCTCNGKDPLGLAQFDMTKDPTLRPGDIVATKDGFVTFDGKRGPAGAFTPVDSSVVDAELNATRARQPQFRSTLPVADDEPGTILQPGQAPTAGERSH
jgi:hypothetical protein